MGKRQGRGEQARDGERRAAWGLIISRRYGGGVHPCGIGRRWELHGAVSLLTGRRQWPILQIAPWALEFSRKL
jgi:hypothetical protein